MLSSVTNTNTGLATSFAYDSSGSGELTKVTFPYGGYMRWQYGATNYAQASWRSVQSRYLYWDSSIGERTFNLSQTLSSDSSATAQATLADVDANAGKKWTFNSSQGANQGFVATYQESKTSSGQVLRQFNYTWSQDAAGRNYISRTQDVMDPGQSYAATRQTDQTIDVYGNLTQTRLYNFSNLTTAAKTYNYTYVTDSNYTSRNIFDRLKTSTVTDATGTLTLATHSYDQTPASNAPGALTKRTGCLVAVVRG